jgi:hypothetical protein
MGILFILIPFVPSSDISGPTYASVAVDCWMAFSGALLVLPWSKVTTKVMRVGLLAVALLAWAPLIIGCLRGVLYFAVDGDSARRLLGIPVCLGIVAIVVVQYFAIRRVWRHVDAEKTRNRAPSERVDQVPA